MNGDIQAKKHYTAMLYGLAPNRTGTIYMELCFIIHDLQRHSSCYQALPRMFQLPLVLIENVGYNAVTLHQYAPNEQPFISCCECQKTGRHTN